MEKQCRDDRNIPQKGAQLLEEHTKERDEVPIERIRGYLYLN